MVEQRSSYVDSILNFLKHNQHMMRMEFEKDLKDTEKYTNGNDFDGNNIEDYGENAFESSGEDSKQINDKFSSSNENNKETSTFVILPASFQGSARYLNSLAESAFAVVGEKGKATFFITLTTNPEWPEIQDKLHENKSPYDSPFVIAMVFYHKLSQFYHLIR